MRLSLARLRPQPTTATGVEVEQRWDDYTDSDHEAWRAAFERLTDGLSDRAAPDVLSGLVALDVTAARIPDFRRLNDALDHATGWRLVGVSGRLSDAAVFDHLAHRRFPAAWAMGAPHDAQTMVRDVVGYAPLLMHPVFAEFLRAFGRHGVMAARSGAPDRLDRLGRLYWYTAQFGLLRTPDGLRAYGADVVASPGEAVYALEHPAPRRVAFDLMRVMRTQQRSGDYQECYVVIDGFEQLAEAMDADFTPNFKALARLQDYDPAFPAPGEVAVPPNPSRLNDTLPPL
jgi:phenylalanine-4-hydroxylase